MAVIIRCDIIDMICTSAAGHPGGSLSAADVVTALYFRVMRIDPKNPDWPDRDRFILSKGHACPVWYAALAERGYFDKSNLKTLRRMGSILQGHPDMRKTPGIDMTAGSLGHGLSAGLGMALSGKLLQKDYHVFVIIGDGESQEGSIWEASMAAPNFKLDNLTAILDYNHLQNDYCVDDLMPIEPLADKWRAFGWSVQEINGHDYAEIMQALTTIPFEVGKPNCVIAYTHKGEGVSFIKDRAGWHHRVPTEEELVLSFIQDAVQDTLGNSYALSTELATADAVVLYFTMWCPICDSHASHMRSAIIPDFPQVRFLLVDYVTGSITASRSAQLSNGYASSTVLVDTDLSLFNLYQASMGTTVVIDSTGIVRMNEDYKDGVKLRAVLEALP